DYEVVWETTLLGTGPLRGSAVAIDAPNGIFEYTFPMAATIPTTATGSYTVAMDATHELPENPEIRWPAPSQVKAIAVTDAVPQERRVVVDNNKCNKCHIVCTGHGGIRTNTKYCPMCHNGNNPNDERAPRFEGTT